jgi:hypothetical protein
VRDALILHQRQERRRRGKEERSDSKGNKTHSEGRTGKNRVKLLLLLQMTRQKDPPDLTRLFFSFFDVVVVVTSTWRVSDRRGAKENTPNTGNEVNRPPINWWREQVNFTFHYLLRRSIKISECRGREDGSVVTKCQCCLIQTHMNPSSDM